MSTSRPGDFSLTHEAPGACHYLNSGQRTCHADDGGEVPCAGSGQDASFGVGTRWPEPRFEVAGDAVTDRLTGLVWCRDASLAEFLLTVRRILGLGRRKP